MNGSLFKTAEFSICSSDEILVQNTVIKAFVLKNATNEVLQLRAAS